MADKTPEEFLTEIAIEINKLYRNKRDAMSGKMPSKGEGRGNPMIFGVAAPIEIPPDIERVHKLLQSAIQTTYLLNNKLDVPNNQKVDFEVLINEVLVELANATKKESPKKAAVSLTITGGGGAANQFDTTYNKIVTLKDQMLQQRAQRNREEGSKSLDSSKWSILFSQFLYITSLVDNPLG